MKSEAAVEGICVCISDGMCVYAYVYVKYLTHVHITFDLGSLEYDLIG